MALASQYEESESLPWIISVDDHVLEPPTLWTSRLSNRDRERGPRVVRDTCRTVVDPQRFDAQYVKGGDGPETDWWVYEDLAKPVPQTYACAGFTPDQFSQVPISYAEMRPGCFEPQPRLADMDLNRTERSLCFPSIIRFCGQMFLDARDKDLALKCVRAYNDWMIEEWVAGSGGRLIPLCIIPLWDPTEAAVEIRRNAARGCRAVSFSELPTNLGLPSIHSRDGYWDPVFAACDETGTVLCIHIGSGSRLPGTSDDAPTAVKTTLSTNNAVLSLTDWLLSGLFVRFPTLKVAYSEGQVGWMPYILERVDRVFVQSRAIGQIPPYLTEKPSSYVTGRVYGCVFEDRVGIEMRHRIGVRQLTFETDYPHMDGTWPRTRAIVADLATIVPPDELEMIMRTNAIDLFGLDAGDLRPVSVAVQ